MAKKERLIFEPFSEWDWIDFPSPIHSLEPSGDVLIVHCADGDYALHHTGTPERDWFLRQIA